VLVPGAWLVYMFGRPSKALVAAPFESPGGILARTQSASNN
jgi:hypothetical protein